MGQHVGCDPGGRRDSRIAAARPSRYTDRLHHFPLSEFHQYGGRQSHQCAAHLLSARSAGSLRLSLRVAYRPDQPCSNPIVADGSGACAVYTRATINTMVLAGLVIAVGGVVDDAIID